MTRHKWGNPNRIAMAEGLQSKTERVCSRCDMVRVTCHPPHGWPWKEFWRDLELISRGGDVPTPPCDARLERETADKLEVTA